MAKVPELGEKVPDFTVASSSGKDFSLRDVRGRKVILYFYPRDNTPGCTIQGQEFSKLRAQFAKRGADVYGISRDSLKSHSKFIEGCDLKIPLLSDEDEKLCRLFDVIKEKNMYGKKVFGIERSTFIIDAEGTLVAEWRKVKAEGHARIVLEALKEVE